MGMNGVGDGISSRRQIRPCRLLGGDIEANDISKVCYNAGLIHGRSARIHHRAVHLPLKGTSTVRDPVGLVEISPDLFNGHH